MNRPEQALQRAVVQYLAYQVPAHVGWWTAIGHGGGGAMRGAILKGMGVKAGVPDFMLGRDGRVYFLELKSPVGRMSREQVAFQQLLAQHKTVSRVVRTIDEVMFALKDWGFVPNLGRHPAPSTQTQSLGN